MVKSIARGLVLLPLGLGVLGSCAPGESGKCDGEIDGDSYQLLVYNCLEQPTDILVNERIIGSVPARDEHDICSYTVLGEFPQCSTGEIYAIGNEVYTEGSRWTSDALRRNADGCWLRMILVESLSDPSWTLPEGDPTNGGFDCQLIESYDPYS